MHTIPFTGLIISVCNTGIRNVLYEDVVVDFRGHPRLRRAQQIYLLLLSLTSVVKVLVQFFGIVLKSAPPAALGQASDLLWLVFALFLPWAKSGLAVFSDHYDIKFPRAGFDNDFVFVIKNAVDIDADGMDADRSSAKVATNRDGHHQAASPGEARRGRGVRIRPDSEQTDTGSITGGSRTHTKQPLPSVVQQARGGDGDGGSDEKRRESAVAGAEGGQQAVAVAATTTDVVRF